MIVNVKNLSFLDKASLVLVMALLLCLCSMPYGFYTIVRLATAIIACCWAYQYYETKNIPLAVTSLSVAILFQPLLKITLDRATWNILDVCLAVLILFVVFYKK